VNRISHSPIFVKLYVTIDRKTLTLSEVSRLA